MSDPASVVTDGSRRALLRISKYLARQELLLTAHRISISDYQMAVEAAVIRAHTTVESALEELFIGLLVGRLTFPARCKVRPLVSAPRSVTERLVTGGQNYANWLPYDKTTNRAAIFFLDGRPFTWLQQPDMEVLRRLHVTRHAVADSSDHAVERFRRSVIGNTPVTARERRPAGYLVALASPTQRRIDVLLAQTQHTLEKLTAT